MPKMWFAKDGSRPNSQSGSGVLLTPDEVKAVVGVHELKFVGVEAPSINAHAPSADVRNVVLEVESPSDVCAQLPKVGFYYVLGLRPRQAERGLEAHRGGQLP